MLGMESTFGTLVAQRREWENLMQAAVGLRPATRNDSSAASPLREIRDFGSNPGALRMFTYLPPQHSPGRALVVVLHGGMQTAASYDCGAGWSTLADRYDFALLLPEQQHSNNPNGCFNWFQSGDIERGQGEALSIRQMVGNMVADHGIDRRRVFVTGLSAGGAMASVMLATYPDVFAGGAIIAGLPYGAASTVQQAFRAMHQCPPRSAPAWGDLIRGASRHDGSWPRLSVWHGGADTTVIPSNASAIVKQWTDVHGLASEPTLTETVDGYPRDVWSNIAGDDLIESYAIPSMAHGTPLAVGEAMDQCGATGAFLLDVGISSSYHIAKFWGLADAAARKEGDPVALSPGQPHISATGAGPDERFTGSEPAGARPSLCTTVNTLIANALNAVGLTRRT
jgi:poly(hydroxyalkanoate) depolymerase family esterase